MFAASHTRDLTMYTSEFSSTFDVMLPNAATSRRVRSAFGMPGAVLKPQSMHAQLSVLSPTAPAKSLAVRVRVRVCIKGLPIESAKTAGAKDGCDEDGLTDANRPDPWHRRVIPPVFKLQKLGCTAQRRWNDQDLFAIHVCEIPHKNGLVVDDTGFVCRDVVVQFFGLACQACGEWRNAVP